MGKARESDRVSGAVATMPSRPPVARASSVRDMIVESNQDENPSFELGLAGVTASDGSVSQSSTKAKYGTYSCRFIGTGDMPILSKTRQDGSRIPVSPGGIWIHSVWGQSKLGADCIAFMQLAWYDSGGNGIGASTAGTGLSDSAWTRVQVKAEAPANAASVKPRIWFFFMAGDTAYIDGQEARQEEDYSEPYIDGDQELCWWEGVAHESASSRKAEVLSCPPVGYGVSVGLTPLAGARRQRE